MKKITASSKLVSIVMGSDSDLTLMQEASKALNRFNISHEILILSAHRAPNETASFAKKCSKRGIRVIIAGAGGAAHLPGVIAAYTHIPIIGVPIPHGHLHGQDALHSIVQMPTGVPVATVAIGNAFNAGVLAVQILASANTKGELSGKLLKYKEELRQNVLSKKKLFHGAPPSPK